MDARTQTPENTNFLSPLHFEFRIKKTPNVNYFVQNVNIPGMSLRSIEVPNPLVKKPYWGDHIDYDDIMINYKVDEDLANYLEIHNWVKLMGFPDNYAQHKSIADLPIIEGMGLTSDISIIVLNSSRIPKFNIVFKDAFPVSISSLIFDVTQPDVNYLEAAATFRYTSFNIEAII
jgi:hypothetical protein